MSGIMRESILMKDVPVWLAKKIGQIIVRFAYLDYRLKIVVWKLSGVTPETGRLAIRDPRAVDKLTLIRDLFHYQRRSIDEEKFKTAVAALEELEQFRDLLAHGVWTHHEGAWFAVKFRGKVTDPDLHPIDRKREVRPESFAATASGLSELLEATDSLIQSVISLDKLVSSRRKPRKLPAKQGRQTSFHKKAKR